MNRREARRTGPRIPSLDDVQRIASVSDPILRNLQITQAYHDLSAAMARLTGIGANWCTLATWASKQAGQSIRREDLVAAFGRLLAESPEVQLQAEVMLDASSAVSGNQARSLRGAIEVVWDAVNPAARVSANQRRSGPRQSQGVRGDRRRVRSLPERLCGRTLRARSKRFS